jgi:serine/threonine-protein kinase HipA
MESETWVYVDLDSQPVRVGRLWARMRKGRDSASFEYDPAWLQRPDRFALEPALQLDPGPFHTPADKPMFGAIGDSAPDRWGTE